VIVEPSGGRIGLPLDRDLNLEGVAVNAAAFVAAGNVGKALGSLEAEILGDSDVHDSSSNYRRGRGKAN
jgi:hypothetical protein